MKKLRLMSILLFAAVLSSALLVPASANSAQNNWSGVSDTGMVCQEEESPLEVTKEVLTFDLPTFPEAIGNLEEDLQAYDSTFTAEYTFYNPSDYTITARLLFPIGTWPEYFPRPEGVSDQTIYDNLEQFDVTVDGQSIHKEIRHSLQQWIFNLDQQMALLRDDYRTDTFLTPETPVTHYRFRYKGDFKDELWGTYIQFPVAGLEDCLVYFREYNCIGSDDDSGTYYPGLRPTDNRGILNVYTFGEAPSSLFQWESVDNLGQPVDAEVTLKDTETVSLEELIFRDWSEDSGISKVDWYNSSIQWLLKASSNSSYPGLIEPWYVGPLDEVLMCWYSYELTLEPGQELVNTVTAPAFPNVSYPGNGTVYDYTYLLSPAKTWSKFGTLDIRINAPLYLLESGLESWGPDERGDYQLWMEPLEVWEEDETGYSFHLDGLPEGELAFTLSTSTDPYPSSGIDDYGGNGLKPEPPSQGPSDLVFWTMHVTMLSVGALILQALLALPVVAVMGLVHLIRKKKQNKRP